MNPNSSSIPQDVEKTTQFPVDTLGTARTATESTGAQEASNAAEARPLSKYVDRVQGRLVFPWLE
ncbi:hypothetical protein [Amaricoccus tamworthensis]|uniref:hypothetical protein n=1 Tax=Amaricoccus tamworthensis TaxID=57002 RepID=UPI003C7A0CE8